MAGIVLASLSSGAGELSFLGLTHYYGPFSQAAWGSGTGAAGLIGAGAYAIATTSIGLSVQASLLASSFLPFIMLLSFFFVLPRGPLRQQQRLPQRGEVAGHDEERDDNTSDREDQSLLAEPVNESTTRSISPRRTATPISEKSTFARNLRRARGLIVP
ncbi:MAG: hypothetical protein Q9224_002144 [Gallowayella concinna]